VLVRTWNLFHGNASPPERRAFLREMVELVTADRPDVVCLQELPVWALSHLERWSGMQAVSAVARRPRLFSAELGRWVTELHHGLFRSALTGEADAILVGPGVALDDARMQVVSDTGLRRIAHRVRLDGGLVVCNAHTTGIPEQLERIGDFVADANRVVVAGDLNIRSAALDGFSGSLPGSIDQILVRGVSSSAPVAWPLEERSYGNRVLSDHAPVELTLG
jgi:endonuclease/exonuclease/phosphatase family metal-dependent hydrolase